MRFPIEPAHKTNDIHRSRRGHVLEMRFFLSAIARSPQPQRTNSLGDGSFYSSATGAGWLGGLDIVTLYSLIADLNPRHYVEIGSGSSTQFARRAIDDHSLRTEMSPRCRSTR